MIENAGGGGSFRPRCKPTWHCRTCLRRSEQMKAQITTRSHVARHRANLKRLVGRLERNPFDFLPERSVECLHPFFAGYSIFGPPIWRDLASFEFWLMDPIDYAENLGSRWWRFIQLRSKDRCDSFDLFCRLYRQYRKEKPTDVQPTAPESTLRSDSFDFYRHLYSIFKKPGLVIGSSDGVELIAAYLAGHFAGKKHSRKSLTRDEKEFLRFGKWLRKHHRLTKEYPWYRLVEMWPRARNSFESFFVEYDAFLTNFGKRSGGLDDLFEIVIDDKGTFYRRRKKIPKSVLVIPNSLMWWRSPANL
jgi:hypothetical protein